MSTAWNPPDFCSRQAAIDKTNLGLKWFSLTKLCYASLVKNANMDECIAILGLKESISSGRVHPFQCRLDPWGIWSDIWPPVLGILGLRSGR